MNNSELLALSIKEVLAQCKHQEISYLIYENDVNSNYTTIDFRSRYNDSVTNKLFHFSITVLNETIKIGKWNISVIDDYKTIVLIPKEDTINGWKHDPTYGGYVQYINVDRDKLRTDRMYFVRPSECNGVDLVSHNIFGLFSFYTKTYTRKPIPIKISYIKVEVEE